MKMNSLWISYGLISGLIQVAGLGVCGLENRLESGAKKLHLRLNSVQNQVQWVIEKAILGVKRGHITNVHFIEYPQLKVKKANSLYVIMEK